MHNEGGLDLGLGQGRETLRNIRTTNGCTQQGAAVETYAGTITTQVLTCVADDIENLSRSCKVIPTSDGGTNLTGDQEEERYNNSGWWRRPDRR